MLFPQCFKVSVSVHFFKPFLGSRVNPRLPSQCRSFSKGSLRVRLRWVIYGGPYMQCTNIFFQCTTYIYSEHKCISECTNLFLSAQIYFSVHKCISQCTNIYLSVQMYFSVHKCIFQCTNIFFSVQIYFSVHKCISQCTNLFRIARQISVHKGCLNEKCNLSGFNLFYLDGPVGPGRSFGLSVCQVSLATVWPHQNLWKCTMTAMW